MLENFLWKWIGALIYILTLEDRIIKHKNNVVDFKYLRVKIDNDNNILEGHIPRTLNSYKIKADFLAACTVLRKTCVAEKTYLYKETIKIETLRVAVTAMHFSLQMIAYC